MLKLFSIFFVILFSISTYAVINGSAVTVSGTTTCNNGVTERVVAGTMSTTCGAGWNVGSLPDAPDSAPFLAFTDINSGPDTGIGDGVGSGAIVTIWGQNLGSTQGGSSITFVDSAGVERTGHVYYWKNADGTLPGAPANLYESHNMQEVAFSIPDSALGLGSIKITTGSGSDELPFTVRAGNIYHAATGGSNSNPCTWASPCEYIDGGLNPTQSDALGNANLSAGDIVYSRGVTETGTRAESCGGGRCIGLFLRSLPGTESSPISLIAYPYESAFSTITSVNAGVNPFGTDGIVISKYSIAVGYADPVDPPNAGSTVASNYHIYTTKHGRSVGNLMTQIDGTCFTGWNGALSSGGDSGTNHKILGNHIKDLGCDNSSRFSHTLYMSIRDSAAVITQPWEISYNYLDNNNTYMGIHNYDETNGGDCGSFTGTMVIKNNVVVNQRGAGINIGTNDRDAPETACWQVDYEITDNVLINTGLGEPAEDGVVTSQAIRVTGDLGGSSLVIKNNTFHGHGEASSLGVNTDELLTIGYLFSNPTIDIQNNVFLQTSNLPWLSTTETITTTGKNSFWSTATASSNSPPAWTTNITTDPVLSVTGSKVIVGSGSPLIDAGSTAPQTVDILGKPRGTTVGAVEP